MQDHGSHGDNDCPNWEATSRNALALVQAGEARAALTLCCAADGLAARFSPGDPRRAASLNNVAVVLAVIGNLQAAEERFGRARVCWEAAQQWLAGIALRGGARSSMIHFRLEQKYKPIYDSHVKRRYATLTMAGQAASAFGHGVAKIGNGQLDAGHRLMGEACRQLDTSLGGSHPIVQHVRRLHNRLGGGRPLDGLVCSVAPDFLLALRPTLATVVSPLGEAGALIVAAGLTAVLDVKPAPAGGKQKPAGHSPPVP